MAFVNEKDPNNSDSWRTVDYERDIVLVSNGRNRDARYKFKIQFEGLFYDFWAYCDLENLPNKKFNVEWHVQNINADSVTEEKLKPIIIEALNAYGLSHSHDIVSKIEADFMKLPNRSPV